MDPITPNYPNATIFQVALDQQTAGQLEMILSAAGYANVRKFTQAARALDVCRESEPDLVIFDLHSDTDGFIALQQLVKKLRRDAHIPVLVLAAAGNRGAKERALSAGAKDFLAKPFDGTEVLLHINNLLETRFLHKELQLQNDRLENMVQRRTAELWDAVKTLEGADKELRLSQEETIRCLSLAGEFREVQTPLHVERMGRYCERLARLADLDEQQVSLIRAASPMHDIGKIGIPDRVLMKPGPLTVEERTLMERHTEIGYRILSGSKSKLLSLAATIALTHHERFDGGGYPQRLRGYDIPIEGRIAAIGDVFDALLSQRPYRSGFPLGKVFKIMEEGRGTHFDPELLDLFLDSATEFLAVSFESLDSGDVPA